MHSTRYTHLGPPNKVYSYITAKIGHYMYKIVKL